MKKQFGEIMIKKEIILSFLIRLTKYTSVEENLLNAKKDSSMYEWDEETLEAILKGILILHSEPNKFGNYLKLFT